MDIGISIIKCIDIVMKEKQGSVRFFGCKKYEVVITYEDTKHRRDFRHQSSSCKSFRDLKCTYECEADKDIFW